MYKMKKIAYLLGSALFSMGLLTSCDDFIVESYTDKATDNFPKTEKDVDQALAGVYSNLNTVNANPQMSFLYWAQLASDDCLGGGGPNDKLMQAFDFIGNSGNDMTNQFYLDRYAGIGRANNLLANLPEMGDDELIAQTRGELLFLRAFYYYELASMYGANLPLMTDKNLGEKVPGCETAAEMWSFILNDLYTAATTMPKKRHTDGHVDRYTAQAMLGRAWLFYTGMYGNGETLADLTSTTYSPLTEVKLSEELTLTKSMVAELINECVNESGYSLVDDFRNLWAYTNRYTKADYEYVKDTDLKWAEDDNAVSPETMFAIKYNKQASWQTTIGYGNGYALHFGFRNGGYTKGTFPFGDGWGAGPVSKTLWDDWSSSDPRRAATIADVASELANVSYGSVKYAMGTGDWVQETGYYAKKFSPYNCRNIDGVLKNEDTGDVPEYLSCFDIAMYGDKNWSNDAKPDNFQLNNIHDLVLIRYADVLLMQSELNENADGINKVRARAGLSPVSYSLKAVQDERRWELACEGIRWNDMRRWHIAADALARQEGQPINDGNGTGINSTNKPQLGGYKARYNATAGFCKIPETQVTLSAGGIKQNAGWEGNDGLYSGLQ